jgi:hypothetical protein
MPPENAGHTFVESGIHVGTCHAAWLFCIHV